MPSTLLFNLLLKPGKLDTYQNFINECTGPKKAKYKEMLTRYGLKNTKMWLQTLGKENYVLFTHDMNADATELLKEWESSTHPFDQWFKEKLHECYDYSNSPPQPIFFTEFDATK